MDTRTLCLGVLQNGAASGYEIKKAFEEGPLAHIHDASFGAIYPALTRMAAEGLVDCRAQPQDKRPDKKIYAMTATGRRAFEAALLEPPAHDTIRSDFLFMLFFAELLPAAHLQRLIDSRIAWYDQALTRMHDRQQPPADGSGAAFVQGFGMAVYGAARDYLVANREWLLNAATRPTETAAE